MVSEFRQFPGFNDALRRGDARRAEQILKGALARGARAEAILYAQLAERFVQTGDLVRGELWTRAGLKLHPASAMLLSLLANLLVAQRKAPEAIALLTAAPGLPPQLRLRLAQLLVGAGEGARALEQLEGLTPDVEVHRAAAGAWRALGDRLRAIDCIEAALTLAPSNSGIWLQRELLAAEGGMDEALAVLDRAQSALPGDPQLAQRRASRLVAAGRFGEARPLLEAALAANPRAVWPWLELGRAARGADNAAAIAHFRAALEIEPKNVEASVALAHALMRGSGDAAGDRLQEAAGLIAGVFGALPMSASGAAVEILWRTGHYPQALSFGNLREVGRYWAGNGAADALLNSFARVETDADRLELLEQHRLWGARLEVAAAATPIVRLPRKPGDRIRLGFLSSDLRGHAVARFVQPLFEHLDDRFELFIYSGFPGPADEVEIRMRGRVRAYRRLPAGDREAAAVICADSLDMLIELGGTTQHNRPGVMAWRPAARQASWLGYPHSLGLGVIDYFIADPHLAPVRPELLIETPLLMPKTWICMGPAAFHAEPHVHPTAPAERKGHVTFGTANNSYKWSPRVLAAWARVLAAVPGSRFLILRPEAGSAALRANVARHFAEAGVSADRLEFRAVSGTHMAHYNDMDIALDTFPLTGGTTTCEALWMGVPTVTIAGPAVYERLSHSILTNAGLGDLSVAEEEAFVARAVALAQAPAELSALRRGMRARIAASPLGETAKYAADFYGMIAAAVA